MSADAPPRMDGETCGHCRFWEHIPSGARVQAGICRRFPPKAHFQLRNEPTSFIYPRTAEGLWPQTLETDCCGLWRAHHEEDQS